MDAEIPWDEWVKHLRETWEELAAGIGRAEDNDCHCGEPTRPGWWHGPNDCVPMKEEEAKLFLSVELGDFERGPHAEDSQAEGQDKSCSLNEVRYVAMFGGQT